MQTLPEWRSVVKGCGHRVVGPRWEAEMILWEILAALGGFAALGAAASIRVIQQYERGLVFRFGRVLERVRGPGLTMIVPFADRLRKVNVQIVTMPVPAQDGITRDNVTVKVDAVVYFRVVDPIRALVSVQNYPYAVSQVAQTSLRSVIGKSDLDDLLTNRERLNQGLELMIDNPAVEWGIHIDRVEIKDVALPEAMKRSMSRQAEAERERRARVISADGELQASDKLARAAGAMADTPGALQLRLLEAIVQVAAEKNSTLIVPFPVELLRFLERNTSQAPAPAPRVEAAPEKAGLQGPTLDDAAALEQAGSEQAIVGQAATELEQARSDEEPAMLDQGRTSAAIRSASAGA
jgi:regulator of protease activity HflC (stomatin/prohibitin superfamily)